MSTEIPLRAGQFTLTRMFVVMAVIGVFLGVARLGMGWSLGLRDGGLVQGPACSCNPT